MKERCSPCSPQSAYGTFRSASVDGSSRRACFGALLRSLFGIGFGCAAFMTAAMIPAPGVFLLALMAGRAAGWRLSSALAYPDALRPGRLVAVGLAVDIAVDLACCAAFQLNPLELLGPLRLGS